MKLPIYLICILIGIGFEKECHEFYTLSCSSFVVSTFILIKKYGMNFFESLGVLITFVLVGFVFGWLYKFIFERKKK